MSSIWYCYDLTVKCLKLQQQQQQNPTHKQIENNKKFFIV